MRPSPLSTLQIQAAHCTLKSESTSREGGRGARARVRAPQIALTGYPLQNNIAEYYTMIDWIQQPILGGEAEFKKLFIDPITCGAPPTVAALL